MDEGNIGDTREIIGRHAVAKHDSREGAQEAEAGLLQRELTWKQLRIAPELVSEI